MVVRSTDASLDSTPAAPPADPRDAGQRLVLHNLTWAQFRAMREATDHIAGLRMSYLDGRLVIVTPGKSHEFGKTLFARLVEAYADHMRLDLNGYGGMTFFNEKKQRSLEPDECYTLGELETVPQLAFEVVVTGEGVEKLEVYVGLGIREVLLWENARFALYRLGANVYAAAERSLLFPELDLAVLASFMNRKGSQAEIVRSFRDSLRAPA